MPKFQVRASAPLRQTLSGLRLAVAFTEAADFSRMSSEPLMLKDVLHHQALAIVDENGTVAAAATAVIGVVTSAPLQPPRAVVLDHPFLYLVRDEGTGAIVFLGRFVRPSS